VKTNLGHSEAASGISGIIKTALALESGVIPATIGVREVNPKIKLAEWNVKVVTENTPWPTKGSGLAVLRAGVNSFGYGGANAHVILEAPQSYLPHNYPNAKGKTKIPALQNRKFLLPVSASNLKALESWVSKLCAIDLAKYNLHDIAYTLGSRRTHLSSRGFLIAAENTITEDMNLAQLQTLRSTANDIPGAPWTFVFTGQGAQWPQMGKELIEQVPSFRASIRNMDDALQKLPHPPSWALIGKFTPSPRFREFR
jgi:acyl transferase domain-containing protein